MYIEINSAFEFKRQFGVIGRADEFTMEGFDALYQHFEDMDDGGWGAKIVPADLCVLWSEYPYREFLSMYTQLTEQELETMVLDDVVDKCKEVIADPAHNNQLFLMTTETVLVGTHE